MRLFRNSLLMSVLLLPGQVPVHSQLPTDPVEWTFVDDSSTPSHRGAAKALRVDAHIKEGWHVYASAQLEGGPTPLKVLLDENPLASLDGKVGGTEALKLHDTSFNLETTVYKSNFFLSIPVRVKNDAPTGVNTIPVSIRYQSCSDRICIPPKTTRIRVPVNIVAAR